jgi:hypothetical protein
MRATVARLQVTLHFFASTHNHPTVNMARNPDHGLDNRRGILLGVGILRVHRSHVHLSCRLCLAHGSYLGRWYAWERP